MAVPALNHKRLSAVIPASGGIEDLLLAIKDALDATTYYDGSSRTPGSGSAWTATAEVSGSTIALRLHPPLAAVSDMAIIVAGQASGSPTPTMIASDTYANDILMAGVLRNIPGSPTYNGWDNASPYSSADFTGYARIIDVSAVTPHKVWVFESQETIWIAISDTGGSNPTHLMAGGAIFLAPSDVSPECESNERLYGIATTGTTAAFHAGAHLQGATVSGRPFGHTATNGGPKCVSFLPGSTFAGVTVRQEAAAIGTATFVGVAGSRYGHPVVFGRSGGDFHAILRDAYMSADLQHGFVIQPDGGGADLAYNVGPYATAVGDSFLLRA